MDAVPTPGVMAGVWERGSCRGRTLVAMKSAQAWVRASLMAGDHLHSGVDTLNLAANTDANRAGVLQASEAQPHGGRITSSALVQAPSFLPLSPVAMACELMQLLQ